MIESMACGTFLKHHLEPSYYEAMLRALNARQRDALEELRRGEAEGPGA